MSRLNEAHKKGCTCGFCQNKGKIHLRGKTAKADKADKAEPAEDKEDAKPTAESIVSRLLDRS